MEKTNELSASLYEFLNGRDLEMKQFEAMMLLTVTEDGWPHSAMVSAGEVVALSRSRLRLALWPGTVTSGNMIRSGRAVLVAVHQGAVHYVRLSLSHLPQLTSARHPRERFEAEIMSIREDTAKYADITSGITILLKQQAEVLARWVETLEELRE